MLTHFLSQKCVYYMCNAGSGLYGQRSISFSSVCVDFITSQFVLKPISTQQDSLPNTRHGLVVLLVISNRVITPINFQNLLVKHVLFADTIFGKTARDSYASCRKYESMSNCWTQAAVTPDKVSLVNLMTTFADILTRGIFFHMLVCYWGCCSASFSSQSSPEKWLDGWRANRRWSRRLFELSSHGSTKPDNILWLFKHYSLVRIRHRHVCSVTAPVSTERSAEELFLTILFKFTFTSSVSRMGTCCFYLHLEVCWCTCWSRGNSTLFNNGQSCCDEVRHAASFGGQQEGRGEEQIGLCRLTSEQFNRRREHRPAAMRGRHWKQLSYQVQKIWVRPFCYEYCFDGMMSS